MSDKKILRRAMATAERLSMGVTYLQLRKIFSLWTTFVIFVQVAILQLRGHPFHRLNKSVDDSERWSRKQIGPAVLLFRVLSIHVNKEQAMHITRMIVLESGTHFLKYLLSDITPQKIEEMKKQKEFNSFQERFFNAEGDFQLDGDHAVRFNVHRCRFVELLDRIDAREIGPLFCEVDKAFFQPELTQIRLHRSQTRMGGQPICDFRFEW